MSELLETLRKVHDEGTAQVIVKQMQDESPCQDCFEAMAGLIVDGTAKAWLDTQGQLVIGMAYTAN